jgi:hypothetical protein
VLIRVQDGWIFAPPGEGQDPTIITPDQIQSLPFTKITGVILAGQVPVGVVTQHQGALSIAFTQLTGQIANSQVPASAVLQHLDDLLMMVDWLISIATHPIERSRITAISVLQHLTEPLDMLEWLVARAVNNRPNTSSNRLFAAENLI